MYFEEVNEIPETWHQRTKGKVAMIREFLKSGTKYAEVKGALEMYSDMRSAVGSMRQLSAKYFNSEVRFLADGDRLYMYRAQK